MKIYNKTRLFISLLTKKKPTAQLSSPSAAHIPPPQCPKCVLTQISPAPPWPKPRMPLLIPNPHCLCISPAKHLCPGDRRRLSAPFVAPWARPPGARAGRAGLEPQKGQRCNGKSWRPPAAELPPRTVQWAHVGAPRPAAHGQGRT